MTTLTKGSRFSPLVKPAITREQLKSYAEASLDNNLIHLDDDVAKKAGLPGVIAHGMLTMAFFGEFLHQALGEAGGGRVGELSCRFKAMVFPGDVVTVNGTVRDAHVPDGAERLGTVHCDLDARNQKGDVTATGHATLILGSA
ncbi:MAG: MaoC family dehydratase N-terminal domain-containing protein [Deltaproteobacteria bacterium]|nr:MaoC family dehydratase N-terminal domain-containing protein [Deltaproteobacteria bacterium]